MPSEVFGAAVTRIDPAGYRLLAPAVLAEQPAQDTTASYRPEGSFGSFRLTCSPT